jgi:hypothetical protein
MMYSKKTSCNFLMFVFQQDTILDPCHVIGWADDLWTVFIHLI